MRISPFAYACFLLPCGVIVVCYLVSTHLGQVAVCFPFYSGCASISAAARQEPAIHIFRMVMLPMTTVFAGFWVVCRVWLLQWDIKRLQANAVGILGVVGAVFLVLYVVFLGTEGRIYDLLRRFGTTVYFGCTGIAQLIVAVSLSEQRKRLPAFFGTMILPLFLFISVSMLILGIVYIPAANFFTAHNVENIIEWNFAFLMHINFALVWILWRRQGLRLSLAPGTSSP
ncbi:MAG: hypothetical protein JJU29_14485 [Verrucomicrobia bacterium]|nr:hypothetical protein [Verrucomicrobiota bacterium]MCH8513310.1 hypothetical protein [Kiritimatiellia bacterium]